VFQIAALLHDVGHCAFSHSIESVKFDGKPLLGTTAHLFDGWGQGELKQEFQRLYPGTLAKAVTHEQIGLALVHKIFSEPAVAAACAQGHWSAVDVARDVRAIMDGGLPASAQFKKHGQKLGRLFVGVTRKKKDDSDGSGSSLSDDLLKILHDLVSGTLDVDRMDYLVRDSTHCGVPYGQCDVEFLVGSLSLGELNGRLELFLNSKAARALDDFLWSRYQLFIQVLNHKTNVALNALLSRAIEDAINDRRFDLPATFAQFAAFTDDYVMSRIFSDCLMGKLGDKSYTKALVDRQLPLHLGAVDLTKGSAKVHRRQIQAMATQAGVDVADLLVAEARSDLIKPGPLPSLLGWDRSVGKPSVESYALSSIPDGSAVHHLSHVFVDRKVRDTRRSK